MLDRFAAFLDQHARILLTTHENPDGDGVGAMLGLATYLKGQGKDVRIVVYPHVPENLAWMDTEAWIEAYAPEAAHAELAAWPDAWIMVAASEPKRLGKLHGAFEVTRAVKATSLAQAGSRSGCGRPVTSAACGCGRRDMAASPGRCGSRGLRQQALRPPGSRSR